MITTVYEHVTLPAQPIVGGSPSVTSRVSPVVRVQAYATFPKVTFRTTPVVSVGGA